MPTSDKGRTGRRFVGAVLATGAIAGALLLPAPAHAASAPGAFVSPQPQPQHAVIDIDLFRAFRDCLAEAAHGEGSDGQTAGLRLRAEAGADRRLGQPPVELVHLPG